MRIKNTNGQYWTGTCFGVEQAAEVYATIADLPLEIDGLGLEVHCHEPIDARYYTDDVDDCTPQASVEEGGQA